MIDQLTAWFAELHGWVFEQAVQPALYALDQASLVELAFGATEFALIGIIEMLLLVLLFRPLEAWFPVEHWANRRALWPDVIYTALNRIGLLPLLWFAVLVTPMEALDGWLRMHNIIPPNLENLAPWLYGQPLLSFLLYLLVLDFVDYWLHRLQHRFDWWWALHALHHSQRQMSYWADDRNHLLDGLITSAILAGVGLLIGVPPAQFVAIVMLTRMMQSLSHANVRFGFGVVGDRLLVSPRFHRIHHGIGVGHEGVPRGCNFAALFPIWDILFGTANFSREFPPTGVRDQLTGRDYGEGFWSQQWLGLQRLWQVFRRPAT